MFKHIAIRANPSDDAVIKKKLQKNLKLPTGIIAIIRVCDAAGGGRRFRQQLTAIDKRLHKVNDSAQSQQGNRFFTRGDMG